MKFLILILKYKYANNQWIIQYFSSPDLQKIRCISISLKRWWKSRKYYSRTPFCWPFWCCCPAFPESNFYELLLFNVRKERFGQNKEVAPSPRDGRELRSCREKHATEADGNPLHLLRHSHGKRSSVSGQDRAKSAFGGCLTRKLEVTAELLWGELYSLHKKTYKKPGRKDRK